MRVPLRIEKIVPLSTPLFGSHPRLIGFVDLEIRWTDLAPCFYTFNRYLPLAGQTAYEVKCLC